MMDVGRKGPRLFPHHMHALGEHLSTCNAPRPGPCNQANHESCPMTGNVSHPGIRNFARAQIANGDAALCLHAVHSPAPYLGLQWSDYQTNCSIRARAVSVPGFRLREGNPAPLEKANCHWPGGRAPPAGTGGGPGLVPRRPVCDPHVHGPPAAPARAARQQCRNTQLELERGHHADENFLVWYAYGQQGRATSSTAASCRQLEPPNPACPSLGLRLEILKHRAAGQEPAIAQGKGRGEGQGGWAQDKA